MYNYFNFFFCDCVEQVLDSILPKQYAKQKFSFLIKNKNRFSNMVAALEEPWKLPYK